MTDAGVQASKSDRQVRPWTSVLFQFELSWRSLTQPETFAAEPRRSATARSVLSTTADTGQLETVLPFVWQHDAPAPPFVEPVAPQLAAPSFAIPTDRGSVRNRIALAACGLLLVTLALAAVRRMEQPSSASAEPPTATVEMGEAGWLTELGSNPTRSFRA